jgi:DNA repair exonuclease SbcCD nuclease subunit
MKSKITFIITDTHFGVKQNSTTWLNSQLDFFYNQLIPHIQQVKESELYDEIRLIHMGDVFDSRSTISTMVATKIVELFTKLCSLCEVIIIAGNHDFYSPNSDDVDTLTLLLKNTGATLYIKDFVKKPIPETNTCWELFVPWYKWGNETIDSMLECHKKDIVNIFTHADIVTEQIPFLHLNKNTRVFSGHLHIPNIKKNLYNIGSCYALNFADANHDRGYYTMIDNGKPEFHPNKYSIRFWRLYNEDIFNSKKLSTIKKNDYIELYISQTNMAEVKYIEKINEYTKQFKNIWVIPQAAELEYDLEKFEGYDIEKITKSMIPEELKDKFNMILKFN